MWEYMSSSSIGCASCMSGWERQGERRERQAEGCEEERESLRRPEG